MKILFEFDEKKCSACGACAVACMDQNDVDVAAGQEHYRKVYQYESGDDMVCISIACLHCPDAPCVTACPVGCLYKDPATGLTRYDTTHCIGRPSPMERPPSGPRGRGGPGRRWRSATAAWSGSRPGCSPPVNIFSRIA